MFSLISFSQGRMYRVFTPEDIILWQSWCNSLHKANPTKEPNCDEQANMMQLVNILKQRQVGVEGHQIMTLINPSKR